MRDAQNVNVQTYSRRNLFKNPTVNVERVLAQVLYTRALGNTSNIGNKYRMDDSFQIIERNTEMTISLKEDQIGDTNCSCEFFLFTPEIL